MAGKFYIYEHWRPDRDECFYVGKGHGRRAYDMRRGRNRWHKFLQAKLSAMGSAVEVRIVAMGMEEADAFALEIERIAFWRADGADLVNITLGGEGGSGRKHTEEWKRANSARHKGRVKGPLSEETKKKISVACKGRIVKSPSAETIEKIKAGNIGKKRSEETRAKLRIVNKTKFLGKRHTAESIEKFSAPQRGRPKSEETKARMRKPKSEAHKKKLSEVNLGKMHSAETRRKLSEIAKADWARRRSSQTQE